MKLVNGLILFILDELSAIKQKPLCASVGIHSLIVELLCDP